MRISDWSSDVCSSDLKLPASDHLVLANISETLGAKDFEGGWLERALQQRLAARNHYQAFGSLYSDLFTRFLEARIKRAQGRSKEAEAILKTAWQNIVDEFGDRSDLAANCAAFQAELLFEQDRVAEAPALTRKTGVMGKGGDGR